MEELEKNIEIILTDTHRIINDYASATIEKIFSEKDYDFIVYPPNEKLTNEEKNIVFPFVLSDKIKFRISRIPSGSRPVTGSSKMNSLISRVRVRASSIFC